MTSGIPMGRVVELALGAACGVLFATSVTFAQSAPPPAAAAPAPAAPAPVETPAVEAAPPEAMTPEEEEKAYQQAIGQAVQEFAAGRWEEARALFKRAHQIEPNARTLRGMGMAAFELRMYVAALRELEAALRDERKPLTSEQRTQAQTLVDQSNAFVGRYQLILEPEGARPYVDAQPVQFEMGGIVLLDVGDHELRVIAEGYRPFTQQLRVDGGQNLVLRIKLEPETAAPAAPAAKATSDTGTAPPPPRDGTLHTIAWITLAGAGAFAIGAGVFWVVGEGQYSDLQQTCEPVCSDAQIADSGVETSDLLTNVFLGLAVASGATSAVLFVLDAGGASGSESESARVEVGPGSLRVSGSF
jgi:hypothetical protein